MFLQICPQIFDYGVVSKKLSEKVWSLTKYPLGLPPPPPPLVFFGEKITTFLLLLNNRSILAETNFRHFYSDHCLPKSRGSIKSKKEHQKINFQSYFNGFRSDIGRHSRPSVKHALGPRMILHGHWKNTLINLRVFFNITSETSHIGNALFNELCNESQHICDALASTYSCADEGFPLSTKKVLYGSEGQLLSSTVCCLIQSQFFALEILAVHRQVTLSLTEWVINHSISGVNLQCLQSKGSSGELPFDFVTLKSHPRDLWPLRNFIRVIRKHDLTNILTIWQWLAVGQFWWIYDNFGNFDDFIFYFYIF